MVKITIMTQDKLYNYFRDYAINEVTPVFTWDKDGFNWLVNDYFEHQFKDGSMLSFSIYATAFANVIKGDYYDEPYVDILDESIELSEVFYTVEDESIDLEVDREIIKMLINKIEIQ